MRKYCICVLCDQKGHLLEYVEQYLRSLLTIADKLLVVVDSSLSENSHTKLLNLGVDILHAKNNKNVFYAWKEAISQIEDDELSQYEELILTNTAYYGAIYPPSEMFNEMEMRDCDFWEILKHSKLNTCIHKNSQGYFIVYKKKVFSSNVFLNYWNKFTDSRYKIIDYSDYFEKAGFKYESYISMGEHTIYSEKVLKNYKPPFIKRKDFIRAYKTSIEVGLEQQINNIIEFLKINTDYDINLIYKDILQNCPISVIKSNLHLNYVLPSDIEIEEQKNYKTALILYIYYEDLAEYCFKYAQSMPAGSDIYIVSSKQSTLEVCKEKAAMLSEYNLIYRLKPNRGRDVSAYLVTCAEVFKNYDLICCMHDKKSADYQETYGRDFQYHCFECNLKTKHYVKNIINTFDKNPLIGMLVPPTPCFEGTLNLIGNELNDNDILLGDLYKRLDLQIPFDNHPVAPFGSMFWIRGKAITPLFRYKWTFEDFPEEPLPINGTISHAIERIYPSIVQDAGYLTGWIMPDTYAANYIDNLAYITAVNNNTKPKKKLTLPEIIFSIRNTTDKRHKIITICGISLKIKRH